MFRAYFYYIYIAYKINVLERRENQLKGKKGKKKKSFCTCNLYYMRAKNRKRADGGHHIGVGYRCSTVETCFSSRVQYTRISICSLFFNFFLFIYLFIFL